MRLSVENNYIILKTKRSVYLWKPWVKPIQISYKKIDDCFRHHRAIKAAVVEAQNNNRHYLENYTGIDGKWEGV